MNAFSAPFLERLHAEDEPPEALVAELAGPWVVVEAAEDRFEVRRLDEGPDETPVAAFRRRELALLAAAALPATANVSALRLDTEATAGAFPIRQRAAGEASEVLGELASFDEHLVGGLELLSALLTQPRALALLLEAANATTLELAGRQLAFRVGAGSGGAAG